MRWGLAAAKCAQSLSCVHLFVTPWTVAHQAPLSMGFSRQEYWSGLPFLPPGDLPNPGMEPESSASPALAGEFLPLSHLDFYGVPRPGVLGTLGVAQGIFGGIGASSCRLRSSSWSQRPGTALLFTKSPVSDAQKSTHAVSTHPETHPTSHPVSALVVHGETPSHRWLEKSQPGGPVAYVPGLSDPSPALPSGKLSDLPRS